MIDCQFRHLIIVCFSLPGLSLVWSGDFLVLRDIKVVYDRPPVSTLIESEKPKKKGIACGWENFPDKS